jgi:hypothetical protein
VDFLGVDALKAHGLARDVFLFLVIIISGHDRGKDVGGVLA